MISERLGGDARSTTAWTPWRRGLDVFDDYAGGGVLSEELADDLVNELVAGPRPRRTRRGGPIGPHTGTRPGPQPSRPAASPPAARPRLTLVRGGA